MSERKILIFLSTEDKDKIVISEKDQKVLKESLARKYTIIIQNYLLKGYFRL